ncbi:MAG: DUF2147 domain-containing protein [Proteobacteria bacterium]|nr:DUF2147 domain-containing protein [Pseudomonadota bacterium]
MACATTLAEDLSSPIGTWKTVDDKTGRVKSLVKIYEMNGKLSGQVVEVYPEPGKDPDPVCDKCTGTLHNHKIKGLVIMWGFTNDGDQWIGGRIFDPQKPGNNEDPYKAKLTLTNGGHSLVVRGYLGFSWIGRSQTWQRAAEK